MIQLVKEFQRILNKITIIDLSLVWLLKEPPRPHQKFLAHTSAPESRRMTITRLVFIVDRVLFDEKFHVPESPLHLQPTSLRRFQPLRR